MASRLVLVDYQKFNADTNVTREEAMVMYAKAMDIVNPASKSNRMTADLENTKDASKWAIPYIQKVLEGKVFVGRSNDSLELKKNLTHAESLAALRNLLTGGELINKN